MPIDNNIISSLGVGSGVNSKSIVEQLVEIERTSKQQPIEEKRVKYETQISDYGLMRSALSLLQDSADLLTDVDTFGAKNATFTDSTSIIPSKLEDNAPVGDYTIEVTALAAAQSLSTTASFATVNDAVGKGVITFSFGEWDAAVVPPSIPPAPPEAFTTDTNKEAFSVTIDDSNNSLVGLRDAINAADKGVQASIINDGAGSRLVITSESGATNELQITVAEDGATPTNTDADGLSRFAFSAGVAGANQQMVQNQAGADAQLIVNGLAVSRNSNKINDVLEGFEFTIIKASPGEVMSINIFDDKAAAEESVRGFVDSFNAFLEAIKPLTGYNDELEENGSLYRDTTSKSIISGIRSTIASAVPGLAEGFTSLATIGIRTELDGTMSIDEKAFTAAFKDNFSLVQNLFAPDISSDNPAIVVNGFGDKTVAGNYDVVITQSPAKGNLLGATVDDATLLSDLLVTPTYGTLTGGPSANVPFVVSAGDYDFSLTVDGVASGSVVLSDGTYNTFEEMAAEIQTQINADATLLGAGSAVDVSHNGTEFVVVSRLKGAGSSVSAFTAIGANVGNLGLDSASTPTAVTGVGKDFDFTVTVDGVKSSTISLTPGSYDVDTLAAHIQSQINSNTTLSASSADVNVVWATDHFEITSRNYGAKSSVKMTAVGADAAMLGLEAGVSTAGVNVAGTVNGVAGFGVGNVLLPALNTDAAGIKLLVNESAATGTINFSGGFGRELSRLLDGYLQNNGVLDTRESNLTTRIDRLDDDKDKVERRIEAYQARLQAQFLAMERIVNSLNSSGGFLDGILDRLPFTAKN